jgi:hypothetical protein
LKQNIPLLKGKKPGNSATGNLELIGTGEFVTEGSARFGADAETAQRLKNELDALKETARDLGVIENISNRITLNREQLNKLNKDEASPFYYKNIVKTAESYDDAKKTLEQWIAADQKLIESKKTSGKSPIFEAAAEELELAQQHAIAMAEIESGNDAIILEMKKRHLAEMIKLYEKYGQDTQALLYELIQTEAALQKAIKAPEIPIGTPEDIELGDVRDEAEFNRFMARFSEAAKQNLMLRKN